MLLLDFTLNVCCIAIFSKCFFNCSKIEEITSVVGIAKGTLYYHFKSKEEILDALIDRIIQGMVSNIRLALSDKSTALQKLISFVGAMKVDSAIGKEITDYAHKPQNALMHQKIQNSLLAVLTPIAAEIIKEGIKEGIVSTNYPEEAAEMLLIYSSVVFDDMNEMTPIEWKRKAEGFVFNMERLLGIKQGSISDIIKYIN